MSTEINLDQLVALAGRDHVVNLLKEAGKRAGEAKDWHKVSEISKFIEQLDSRYK